MRREDDASDQGYQGFRKVESLLEEVGYQTEYCNEPAEYGYMHVSANGFNEGKQYLPQTMLKLVTASVGMLAKVICTHPRIYLTVTRAVASNVVSNLLLLSRCGRKRQAVKPGLLHS